ncbi:MotA/TolQ/ExbB proton channel family protein [Lignipirellula cremea]|uniref:Colicin uptake protein TolQ n=1 Tax=Lignipirellula cremea TaxID=2528010 RepID=A0A518DSB3_9BACT|nr:MotA/TolQ/ExbB proton channel family protein [Lignipirellula cremea]QDU94732.1 colicin uptake protein TolQ [Lignipirellula cremea]
MPEGISVFEIVANSIYLALALIALWGAYCVMIVWMRVSAKRFKSEEKQTQFLEEVELPLSRRDYNSVVELCEGDSRAMPQLILMAVENRQMGYNKVRQFVIDRFQRDVLADLEYRLSWVNTVIKSAPMIGLLGTVVGMMGAFAQLATADQVKAEDLASDIQVALITTACGLSIAIPLVLCTASINVRIRKMEDLVAFGLSRFFDAFRASMKREP